MTIDTYTDHLAPGAPTWQRQPDEPTSIADVPKFWLDLAAIETDAVLAESYRRSAATLERYLSLRGRLP